MYNSKQVPLMFQAQVKGRCQLQYVTTKDADRWVDEWIDKAYPNAPNFGDEVQTRVSTLSWRFVTNGGQDDEVIRPVIGAKGWPFYPGSSMKGVFRRACTPKQADRYCGKSLSSGDFEPGILRFHGGYPTNEKWQENLLDIIHPQQNKQVKNNQNSSAFVQVSLYKPEIKFGISSTISLEQTEWETIWKIWDKALSTGIGCRVSAGYGQPKIHGKNVLYSFELKGQGQTAKRLDNQGEFRPNIFKAAIRGHALRIFGGLTSEQNADDLVQILFGGIEGEAKVGLLGMAFDYSNQVLDNALTYNVEGNLKWLLQLSDKQRKQMSEEQRNTLKQLAKQLTQFAMLFGGFGKSWRRADHCLFLPDYKKYSIGCHWEWAGKRSPVWDNSVRKLEDVAPFINAVRETASLWMLQQGITPTPQQTAAWREAWHENNVQVWGRVAKDKEDSIAIRWLHEPYNYNYQGKREIPLKIKGTSVTGKLNQIGRLWHRMYPQVLRKPDPQDPKKALPKPTNRYLELLTLFPDGSIESNQFLEFLESQQKMFEKLWTK